MPAGPPSPQLTDLSTFTPNHETLLMNPGDVVVTHIQDTSNGLLASVSDLTTHQTGYIVASAKNGFMNTNYKTCAGTPFNFHPEYNTARQQNQVPWAALEGGVLMEQEIGHFEPCSSITNGLPYTASFPDGSTFNDKTTAQTCKGGFEGKGKVGEGPCSTSTGVCQNATTEGGAACPSDNFTSGALCEYSDMTCVKAGPRPVLENSTVVKWDWPVSGCQDNFFQNGDLDFDGSSYIKDWPNGSPRLPSSFAYIGPFSHGKSYPQIQFETDVAGVRGHVQRDNRCGLHGATSGAKFYPFWSLSRSCVWNFGNVIPGQTAQAFGGDAQYGTPEHRPVRRDDHQPSAEQPADPGAVAGGSEAGQRCSRVCLNGTPGAGAPGVLSYAACAQAWPPLWPGPAGRAGALTAACGPARLAQVLRPQAEEQHQHDQQVEDGDQAADVRPGAAQRGQVAAERQHDDHGARARGRPLCASRSGTSYGARCT